MLSDNIRKYRKSKQMSQDELAEKLEVTRQSISLWETGQTQPSLDNIVALAKLFDISTDALLADTEAKSPDADVPISQSPKTAKKKPIIITAVCLAIILAASLSLFLWKNKDSVDGNAQVPETPNTSETVDVSQEVSQTDKNDENVSNLDETDIIKNETESPAPEKSEEKSEEKAEEKAEEKTPEKQETAVETPQKTEEPTVVPEKTEEAVTVPEKTEEVVETPASSKEIDLYGYLKDFVVQNGTLNGDHCYYSKSADNYGGYAEEDFSLYYWGDTDKIEFCLHSVLDETFSINFYLYVPKKHTGNYEYISSYYYRDNGEPLYEARGVIKGGEFTKNYPLNCDSYYGSADVQNEFMEMSRQGICDAIECLKNFVRVEKLEYSFSDFGFVKF